MNSRWKEMVCMCVGGLFQYFLKVYFKDKSFLRKKIETENVPLRAGMEVNFFVQLDLYVVDG